MALNDAQIWHNCCAMDGGVGGGGVGTSSCQISEGRDREIGKSPSPPELFRQTIPQQKISESAERGERLKMDQIVPGVGHHTANWETVLLLTQQS